MNKDFVVESEGRLDKLVAHGAGVSRQIARTWISSGRVSVNGQVVKILLRPIKAGARISISVDSASTVAATLPTTHEPSVIAIDKYILAINKPSSLLSESDRFGSPSVETWAPKFLEARGERSDIWLVHRLDAGTTGVLILARSKTAVQKLSDAFRERTAEKTYVALVSGRFAKEQTLSAPIAHGERTRHIVSPQGKPAETHFVPLAANDAFSLVMAKPKTGRTHQIRVHLAHLGHAILGDRLYGGLGYIGAPVPEPVPRVMLHALSLSVAHPIRGDKQLYSAKPPSDFLATLARCGLQPPKELG